MHLQQTKRASRETGGPQYYFHDLSDPIKIFLRKRGAVRVAFLTPYGATKSDYFAVSKVHKMDGQQKPVAGSVGHDRIQMGSAAESIGESIRKWYKLPAGDFERIDINIEIRDEVFYLMPLKIKYAGRLRTREIRIIERPLTFTHSYASQFWKEQIERLGQKQPELVAWSLHELCRIVSDHLPDTRIPHIQEPDLLRASGPLKHLGVTLGGYVGKGYDCFTNFQFLDFPPYTIPVEIKRNSQDFRYQQQKYGKEELSRAVVLCAVHGHRQMPSNIDVIELSALCRHAASHSLTAKP